MSAPAPAEELLTAAPTAGGGARSPITSHVLDTALGRPARGVPVLLERRDGESGDWTVLASEATNDDGRCEGLLERGSRLPVGVYRVTFDTAAYYAAKGEDAFYPEVAVVFALREPAMHYHIPLLLSPYSYSTYRGS